MKPEILYEDNHLIIVNKPPGVLVHGDKTGDETMEEIVKQYLKETYNKPGNVFARSVHRLDRPVSGALLIGKTSKGNTGIAKQLIEV
jgi:23S rRNA pseudouridine1911/1915/1917 synthase